MKDWTKPHEINDVDFAFGRDVKVLLPKYKDVPDKFKRRSCTPENKLVSKLFFLRGSTRYLVAKEGIDRDKALKHIIACLRSWGPKHEHKEAGCAYLFNLWFTPESIKAALADQRRPHRERGEE